MIVPVRQANVQEKPVQLIGEVTLDITEEFTLLEPATFSGQCQCLGDGLFLVSGTLAFVCSTPCARCLKPTVIGISIPFEERFARELTAEEEEIYPYTGNEIDLAPALNEAANMALPLRVLCIEDCKGLCPQCGADRNESECGCQTASDSAFSVLKQLDLPEEV